MFWTMSPRRRLPICPGGSVAAPAHTETLEGRTFFAVTPNDPYFTQQWALPKISAPQAWDLTTGSSAVVVNVNDSGIDYTHPDLYLNIWLNQKEIPFAVAAGGVADADADGIITFWDLNATDGQGGLVNGSFASDVNGNGYIDAGDLLDDPRWEDGVDGGANGYVDDLVGWDFVEGDNDPSDDNSHGTACAGIIGALGNNGEGGAGIAWRVQLMATKGGDGKGREHPADFAAGIYYSSDNGARISSNSWGFSDQKKKEVAEVEKLYGAVEYAEARGVLFIAGAGNNATDNDLEGATRFVPASFDLPNVISVAASTEDDQLASFSSYGVTTVDLAAPGQNVGSTIPVAMDPSAPYAGFGGTSAATPHVAGAAALLLARNPGLSYAQLRDAILSTVDRSDAFAGTTASGGRLNVFAALEAVAAPDEAVAPSGSSLFSTTLVSSSDDLLATEDETQNDLLA